MIAHPQILRDAMQHLVNIAPTANLEEVLAVLSQYGTVTTPHPRTPRMVVVEADVDLCDDLHAIPGVASGCDCDSPMELHVVQTMDPDQWALAHISGTVGTYEYDFTGAGQRIYIVDTPMDVTLSEFSGRAAVIHNPFGGAGFHGTATSSCAAGLKYGVAKDALIYNAAGFAPDGTGGSTQTLNAALNAVADHIEDNPITGRSIVSMSWGSSGFLVGNPFGAVMQRLTDLGAILICSSGNGDGENGYDMSLTYFGVWPAEDPLTVAVGAHDINDRRTDWSNYPADLNAPGSAVQCFREGGTVVTVSGTSFSCPYTSGAVACIAEANIADPVQHLLDAARSTVTNVPKGSISKLYKAPVTSGATNPPPDPDPPTEPDPEPTPKVIVTWEGGDAYAKYVYDADGGDAQTVYTPSHIYEEV